MCLDKNIADYEAYHKDLFNIKIHIFCVPLIILSVIGTLNAIPIAWGFVRIGHIVCLLYLSYYIFYARPYLLKCFVMFAAIILIDSMIAKFAPQFYLAINISIFVVSWIIQLWGHKIEGNKPAFIDNKETGFHSTFMAPILVIRHIGSIFE